MLQRKFKIGFSDRCAVDFHRLRGSVPGVRSVVQPPTHCWAQPCFGSDSCSLLSYSSKQILPNIRTRAAPDANVAVQQPLEGKCIPLL
jgi:hypothetical protein